MAKLVVGSFGFDMNSWDLSDIAGGTVTSDSSTEVDVSGAGAFYAYTITGTGFTTFDANGFPTDGTVTGVTMAHPGHTPLVISNISISAADFMGFVSGNDPTGLEAVIFAGNDSLTGRAGNDVLSGYDGADNFNLSKGGNDTANGGDGNDLFNFGAAFTAADSVDGGTGSDKVVLDGDYSGGVTFGAATMVNVETMSLVGSHSYKFALDAATDTVGQSLNITAATLNSTHVADIDGSAVTGSLRLAGGTGADILRGGAGSNVLIGGAGDDTIYAGTGVNNISGGACTNSNTIIFSNWTAGNFVDGGGLNAAASRGVMVLDGDFSAGLTLTSADIKHIELVQFTAGHDYNLTFGSGSTTNDFSALTLGAGDSLTLTVNAAAGTADIGGGAGDDTITLGSAVRGIINLSQGGDDTVTVASPTGNTLNFGNTFTAADTVNGAGANDIISLTGNINLTLGATTISNVGEIAMSGGDHGAAITSDLTTVDANVAAGHTLAIGFASTRAVDINIFDGSAETDGTFRVGVNGAPESHITGGAGNDTLSLVILSTVNTASTFDGGGGNDTLSVDIGLDSTIAAHMLSGIEELDIDATQIGAALTLANGNLVNGQTLIVHANADFNGSKETHGNFVVSGHAHAARGGAGDDVLSLSLVQLSNDSLHFEGNGGSDTMTSSLPFNGQSAVFIYNKVSDSTSTTYDVITDFGAGRDFFQMKNLPVTGVDTSVATGALSTATFDSDLATAVGSGQLAAHHAVVFNPDSGTLSGHHFVVIDANGVAGYQAGQDYVIQIDTAAALTASEFIT